MTKSTKETPRIPFASDRRGTVLVIVLVTIVFTAAAMLIFLERATDDLLIATRDTDSRRLRAEAYSALETTLAVLEDFRVVNGSLRSPAEGWSSPLEWAEYQSPGGFDIEVNFIDESGKMSLPSVNKKTLQDLFTHWELPEPEIDILVDSLLTWMRPNYNPTTAGVTHREDYENESIPFKPPGRSLRSWEELRSIDGVRERFFNEEGLLNELGQRFINTFSLYEYDKPNINAATADALATLAEYEELDILRLQEYLKGEGSYTGQGPGFFKNANDATLISRAASLRSDFGTQIRALWVIITVRQGTQANFRLSTLIAPQKDGATFPEAEAQKKTTNSKSRQSSANNTERRSRGRTTANAAADQAAKSGKSLSSDTPDIRYPFTILEMRENDFPTMSPNAENALEE